MTTLTLGLGISSAAGPGVDPVAAACRAEQLDFDYVSLSDHPGSEHATFEAWTVLTWIAASTTRITVLPRVLGVPFRAPALAAKAAETLDRLSDGRLVLGLGAGGNAAEIAALGLPVGTPGDRLAGLRDAIRISRGLWREPTFTHEGAIHSVRDAHLEPKPRREIPIWLGTFGPRALRLTGELADGWIPSRGYQPDTRLPQMRERVLDAAAAAGRDAATITCALNVAFELRDERGDDVLVGPPAAVADGLVELAGLGFTSFNLIPVRDDAEQVERLAGEVLPAVRQALA